ncbi:hypothetical protein K474DRAFT_1678295 [Panus rudis PR-1116 ss-1]|nr:hypothetical protein K474DRAFT_1678295 [Panus rudis PR-1116 ss-1]
MVLTNRRGKSMGVKTNRTQWSCAPISAALAALSQDVGHDREGLTVSREQKVWLEEIKNSPRSEPQSSQMYQRSFPLVKRPTPCTCAPNGKLSISTQRRVVHAERLRECYTLGEEDGRRQASERGEDGNELVDESGMRWQFRAGHQ